jgi:hypothetical protein
MNCFLRVVASLAAASTILGTASAIVLPNKRFEACAPIGNLVFQGPSPGSSPNTTNTPADFTSWPLFNTISKDVANPAGFEAIAKSSDAAIKSTQYITRFQLDLYKPALCAEQCDKLAGCDSCKLIY